jgi:hypothetical protein
MSDVQSNAARRKRFKWFVLVHHCDVRVDVACGWDLIIIVHLIAVGWWHYVVVVVVAFVATVIKLRHAQNQVETCTKSSWYMHTIKLIHAHKHQNHTFSSMHNHIKWVCVHGNVHICMQWGGSWRTLQRRTRTHTWMHMNGHMIMFTNHIIQEKMSCTLCVWSDVMCVQVCEDQPCGAWKRRARLSLFASRPDKCHTYMSQTQHSYMKMSIQFCA